MKHYPVVIVGAGVSGRLAAVLRPDAMIVEAAAVGRQRIAAMVGTNYLHEFVPELNCTRCQVVTGYDPEGYRDELNESFPLKPVLKALDGVAMSRYQRKCRGWEMAGDDHIAARPGRYDHEKVGWRYELPEPVQAIAWSSPVYRLHLADHRVIVSHNGGTHQISYDVLIWTAPFNAVWTALGFDATCLKLEGKPIYYKALNIPCMGEPPLDADIYVQYVPDETTPIYRRTFYKEPNQVTIVTESVQPLDGFLKFWPGKVTASPMAAWTEEHVLRPHDVHLAGRFARWDPDELTHHTAERLRSVLR